MSPHGDHKPRRSRHLRPDEHTLWSSVTRAVKPLRSKPSERAAARTIAPAEAKAEPIAARGRFAPPIVKKEAPPPPPPLAPLERRLRQRLGKGNAAIDRRLDLHGLTQREAHDALVHFLRSAHAHGARIVLVVTGKGGRDSDRDPFVERGVLRRLVPHWLKGAEFRNLVVGFDTAHIGHGGEGALYVRLRRKRTGSEAS
jgi:DNA-nicking Smr family endonuclease